MATGVVKFWNDRAFGFVVPDAAGPDVFVHVTALRGGLMSLTPGQRVEYEMTNDRKAGRPKADNVRAA